MKNFIDLIVKHRKLLGKTLIGVGVSVALVGGGFALNFVVRPNAEIERNVGTTIEVNATLELPETITIEGQGGLEDIEVYPYVESVDGGQFFDGEMTDVPDGEGVGDIEVLDTSSPQAFVNDTLGKCILGNNFRFGYQCVS